MVKKAVGELGQVIQSVCHRCYTMCIDFPIYVIYKIPLFKKNWSYVKPMECISSQCLKSLLHKIYYALTMFAHWKLNIVELVFPMIILCLY